MVNLIQSSCVKILRVICADLKMERPLCRHWKTEPCNLKLCLCFGVASPPPIDLERKLETDNFKCLQFDQETKYYPSHPFHFPTHQRDGVERASVVPDHTASTTHRTGGAMQIHCRLGFCKYFRNAVSKLSLHSTT